MIGSVKKPDLKRLSDSSAPVSNKKFKSNSCQTKEKKENLSGTEIKVKPKKDKVKIKPNNADGFKSKKVGFKSKTSFNKFSNAKKPFNDTKGNVKNGDAKPNWNEFKQEKKQQKLARKEKKHGLEIYELSVKAKALWEKLRTKSTPLAQKEGLCNDLFKLVKKDVGMLIHSHDLARVIQSLIKYGTPEMHAHIGNNLCKCFLKAATSKYGRFCVKASLKKCSAETRASLVKSSLGNIVKLFCHKFGNPIVEDIYTVWANASTRRAMRMEFYGDLGKLLSVPSDRKYLLDDLPEDLKLAILSATKLNITKVLDKKQLFKSSLLHAVFLDFLRVCESRDRDEILEAIHSEIESLLTSSEGQKVAIMALWHGTNKMKKVAVKSVKGKVKQFSESEFGHCFIMAMFDSVDDTVLINKVIIPELLSDLDSLLKNEYSRRVLLYLVAHRDPAYFHPKQLQLLRQGDTVRNSKKDDKQRQKELLAVVSETILQKMTADPALWCRDSSTAMVMLAVFKSASSGELLDGTYKALVDYILNPESTVEVKEKEASVTMHAIESCGVHMALKKLMIHEQEKADEGQNNFAKCLVSSLTDDSLSFLLQRNRGAFTLVFVLENGSRKTVKKLRSKLEAVIPKLDKKTKKSTINQGVTIIMKKLQEET